MSVPVGVARGGAMLDEADETAGSGLEGVETTAATSDAFPAAGLDEAALARVLAPFDPAATADVYPLSALQTGILFHALHRPDRSDYLSQNAYRIEGDLDAEVFVRAWTQVLERHPALRTTFAWADLPHPVQIVHRGLPARIRRADWRGRFADPDATAAALEDLLAAERARPLDLEHTPPMCFDLIRTGAAEHLLAWHQHHILFDGWSTSVVLDEVYQTYAALLRGERPRLAAPVPYRRHIDWLGARDREAEHAFWRRTMAGFGVPTRLPFVNAAEPDGLGVVVKDLREVPEQLFVRLRDFGREHRLTVNTILQGVWALVLSRHSGGRDVVHGAVMSGRSGGQPGIESTVGLLANSVPVRVDVDPAARVVPWLTALQRHLNDLRKLEHSGLADVRRCSEVMAGEQLFETVVNFTAFAPPDPEPVAGLRVSQVRAYEQIGYPLGVTAVSRRDGLLLQFAYEPGRLPRADAERFFDHVEQALADLVADPRRTLGEVSFLGAEELRLVTRDWAAPGGAFPRDATVGGLFEQAVDAYPDAVALAVGDSELTYAALDAAANRIARMLRRHGVTCDCRVGIALPKSEALAVAVLGVVKAGGACLALDPANPPARNALLIGDADPAVVLACCETAAGLGDAAAGRTLLLLDDPATAGGIAAESAERLPDVASPLSFVHVCYTSGSTGTPKGVGLNHRAVVRFAHRPDFLASGPGEVFGQLQSLAWDGSLIELYATWLNGGELVMPQPGRLDIPDIAALLKRHGITTLGLTTALFHQIVQHDIEALASVRQMITGGDVLLPEAFTAPLHRYPGISVIACYGPTENTTITTSITVTDPEQVGARVPIGRPVRGSTVYVLDESLRPVPAGVVGELYTGGDGVARGYLNQPAATAGRFLPDPFSRTPGARMYKTGDLARWRGDGVLDFVGRADNQVKVRGFRIELGEIEARLTQHPGIGEAVVVALPDASGHKRLVAYLVAAPGAAVPGSAETKRFLQQTLPVYMTPSAVVPLPRLPLNSSGKVDKAKLPDPAEVPQDDAAARVAPRDDAERVLAELWAQILGRPEIGVHDNFFELGGDSILSIKFASQARKAGIALSSADVFAHQTIAELAAAVAGGACSGPLATAEQGPVVGELPFTPIQRAFLSGRGPHDHFNQSRALRWRGSADADSLRGALAALLLHHDALRTRVASDGGSQRIGEPGSAAGLLEVVDLADGDDAAAVEAVAQRVQAGLRLADGRLLRAALMRAPGHHDRVLIAVHHLAVDAVSWSFLLEDLATAYAELAGGADSALLPPKTSSFSAWAHELADRPSVGVEESAPLPVDDDGANTYASVGIVSACLTAHETEAVLRRPRGTDLGTPDVLLAALGRTLFDWSTADGILIDVEKHGRDLLDGRLDVSRTVGWFTAIHPVALARPDFGEPGDLGACVRSAREGMREAARRGAAEPGHAQVSFNYLGQLGGRSSDAYGPFDVLPQTWGSECDARMERPYLLDVVAAVRDGVLTMTWMYSEGRHRRATIEALAQRHVSSLRELAVRLVAEPAVTAEDRWLDRLGPDPALLSALMARYRTPGAGVAVARDGVIQAWGRGTTEAGGSDPVTTRTVFQLGSVSKHLTAFAVSALVQSGRLDLDTEVNHYLRGWELPSAHGPITLRTLLDHTSGLSQVDVDTYAPDERLPAISDLLAGSAIGMVRAPGSEYEYSGANYAVIEKVVADVTGLPYAAAMDQLVLRPLGMADSSFEPGFPKHRGAGVALAHSATGRRYPEGWRNFPSIAAGGMWSTPRDLALAAVEILDAMAGRGKVMTGDSARALTGDLANGYGLGTVAKTAEGRRWIGHPGDSPGFRALTALDPASRTAVVVAANGDGAGLLLEELFEELQPSLLMRVQGPRKFT